MIFSPPSNRVRCRAFSLLPRESNDPFALFRIWLIM